MSSLIGRTLGRYEILDEISRGGMGVVYRARDTRLDREVALKVLPPELVADPERRGRFVQEARAASALEHPHIAVIHEIDEVDGISFIAMELLRGEKLSDMTGRGPLPPARALDLAVEIAEGLARAHDKGIVHRDLKPANVVLTDDGHAKIIDFGLAKLVDSLSGDSGGVTIARAETDPGMVLGTVSYMSPEQARGAKVDHRSDVFSFGVLLHEMLTGRPPFRGGTGIDTMHAILHDPAPPLPPLGATVSPEATSDVQRILEKCLAKEPAERYQGMRDVVVDLRAARRKLESTIAVAALRGTSAASDATHAHATAVAPATARVRRFSTEWLMRARGLVFAAAGVFVVGLLAYNAWQPRPTAPAAAPNPSAKPSVAVLYFENNTGNPKLDWLRTGLTDMLVTDLSQSPNVEVLGTDRLVQILTDMRRQDDRVVSFDTVQEIAKRAGVTSVLLGSYVKAGDTIRINTKLQEASTGRIVTSERVEAIGESNLFATVDDLTRRIKAKFAMPAGADPTKSLINPPTAITTSTGTSIDRDLKDVTTSSIEAYRYYAEGINEHERSHEQAAVEPLEKAVAIDPTFALALAKLAVVHRNLGHSNLRREYAERALQHVDRLTPRERFYIEGSYYSDSIETLGKAIDAYTKAIELYPDAASSRNNLALLYMDLERYDEAIREYEYLQSRSFEFPGTYRALASAHASLGAPEKGREVLERYLREHPDAGSAYTGLGDVLLAAGKIDEAAAAYERGLELSPASPLRQIGGHDVAVLRERWTDADAIGKKIASGPDTFGRMLGRLALAEDAFYKGRLTEGLRLADQAAGIFGPTGSAESALTRNFAARVLMATGQPGQGLAVAERALKDAAGRGPEWDSLALVVEGHSRLGHAADAARVLQTLTEKANVLPSEREKRRVLLATGILALQRRDVDAAIKALAAAEQRLAPSYSGGPVPPHVPIWFAAGEAYLAGHRDTDAAARFQKIVDSGSLRVGSPIEFVRSLYYLGQINERKGDRSKATEYYRRFVQYWGEGEIDRERVAEARKKLN